MEFPCVIFPIPKEAITANRANSQPSTAPSFLFFSPFFIVYIGPPDISPFSLTSLYLIANIHSENLEERPKQADIHIHTNAPAPPETIAVATPTILPVPIVAARAVVSAENGETSPVPRLFVRASLLRVFFNAHGRFLHVRKLQRTVKSTPVPTKRTNMTGPQTNASIWATILLILNIFLSPLFFRISYISENNKRSNEYSLLLQLMNQVYHI
jgi:hypothetical protein